MSIDAFRTDPTIELARELCADAEHAREALAWALPQWSELGSADRELFARAVPLALGRGAFVDITATSQGDLTHQTARYEVDGEAMVLVPGGQVELGWERAPLDSFEDTWKEVRSQVDRPHGIQVVLDALDGSETASPELPPKELHGWLDSKLSPHRTVTIAPYLIAQKPSPVPWDQITVGDDDMHHALEKWLRTKGVRLPNPDEWEYATSGGSRTLFRWGNYWPNDVDTYCVTEGEAFRPNAFGLTLNIDPYWPEVTSDGGQMRGGDGGEMVCGGAPAFATWLTQMPGFIYDLRYIDYRDICLEQALFRPSISVTEDNPAPIEFGPPNPRDDLQAASVHVRQLAQRYDGLRARPGRELERLKKELPLLREIAAAHENEFILTTISALLRRAGEDDEAVATAERAVAVERNLVSLATLGLALRCAGRIDDAIAALLEAQSMQPNNPNPFLDIGDMLAEAKRIPEAIAHYEKALDVEPANSWAKPSLLYWKATEGDEAAKAELQAFVDANPRHQYARSLWEKLVPSAKWGSESAKSAPPKKWG